MTFTKTVTLPVTADEAFALVTRPERLRRWQTVSAYVDLRAGGAYRWTVTPGHHAAGTVHEVEPGRRIVFGWGWDEDPELPKDASTVTITLEPVAEGTAVTLTHEGLTAEQAALHAEGWKHYLERLEKLAATGDAGPDEWTWAPEGLDPIVAAEAALASLQPVLRGVTDADLRKPTPCADLDCGELAEHLIISLAQLGAMAGGTVTDPAEGGLENRVSVTADQVIAAWRRIDMDGTVPGPAGEMPAAFGASILPVELLLHGWDLAQASGQQVRVSDEVVAYVATLAEKIVPGARGRSFADEVAAAPHASPLERLAAYSGRTPIAA